jgi:imidazolonepropionase-like amidohydrolase
MNRHPLAALLLTTVLLPAQSEPRPTLVVRGGTLFDAELATGRPLGQLWLAADGVLGERPADTAIPDGVRVLDAQGHTVLPGLFDLHAHVASHGGPFTTTITPEENLTTALLCGTTHVVDLHGDEASVFALRERARGDHQMARLWCAGGAFTAPGGHATQFGIPANTVESLDDVAARFTALLPKNPDVVKLILEHGGWGGLPRMPTLDDELARAVVDHAHRAGKRAFSHVWSLDEARAALAAGADALVHGVFLGAVDAEFTAAMTAAKTAYVPTLSVVLASVHTLKRQRPYHHDLVHEVLHPDLAGWLDDTDQGTSLTTSPMARLGRGLEPIWLQNLKALADAGVPLGLGTDAGNPLVPHGPGVLHELCLYVAAGLPPAQALQAATIGSARVLGVADRFGSLAAGKAADVVLVAGDALADIRRVWHVTEVVKDGRVVDRAPQRERNARRRLPAEVVVVTPATATPAFPFGGTIGASTDAVAGGNSRAELVPTAGRALHVRGELKAGFTWGPWTGAAVLWHPERRRLVDASACTGVRLRLRGSARPLTVTLQCAAVKDYNVFTATVAPTDAWQTLDVPFAELRQIGYGKKVAWTAKDVTGLSLEFRSAPMAKVVEGPVELEVETVTWY